MYRLRPWLIGVKPFESHEQFPERVNVGFMQIVDRESIRLRVFERGVGETQACGTGACAAVVSGVRLGLLAEGVPVKVSLPGGDLFITWSHGEDVFDDRACSNGF